MPVTFCSLLATFFSLLVIFCLLPATFCSLLETICLLTHFLSFFLTFHCNSAPYFLINLNVMFLFCPETSSKSMTMITNLFIEHLLSIKIYSFTQTFCSFSYFPVAEHYSFLIFTLILLFILLDIALVFCALLKR